MATFQLNEFRIVLPENALSSAHGAAKLLGLFLSRFSLDIWLIMLEKPCNLIQGKIHIIM